MHMIKTLRNKLRKGLKDTNKMLKMEHIFESERTKRMELFDFKRAETIDMFRLLADSDMGGNSRAAFYFDTDRAVFEGVLDTAVPPPIEGGAHPVMDNSGFAAVVSRESSWDLEDYNALVVTAKTDGRIYVTNLRASGPVPDDLFQCHTIAPPGVWTDIILPFDKFVITNRGFVTGQIDMDSRAIETIGILMAQRKSGPFRLELKSIAAVNLDLWEGARKRWTGVTSDSRAYD